MLKVKSMYLLYYFLLSLFFMEIVFRLSTKGEFFSFGLVVSLVFSVTFAIVFFIICSLFKSKVSYSLSAIFLSLFAFIFASQHVYFDTFRTFYSVYSAGNATQIFEFWRDFWYLISQNVIWILPFFLPVIILLVFGKKYLSFQKLKLRYIGGLVLALILVHSIGVTIVLAGGKTQHSAYDLYFNSRNPVISTDRLGLITTMRIDLQRQMFGWSPSLEVVAPLIPEPTLETGNEDNEKDMEDEKEENIDGEKDSNNGKKEEVIIEYNMLDIDFDELIANEEDQEIKEMHRYFASVSPTSQNEYTGKFEGYNLILITAESYAPYAVHEEATPTLHKLINEGFHFTNFYTPLWEVSTTDGEYVALTGLLPKSGVWSFTESASNDLPFVMGNQLNDLGYKTVAYHNHTYSYYNRDLSHPNMGYKYKGIGNGLNVRKIWPASDLEMMEVSLPEYIDDEPFHAYYMTVSGHMQYSFDGNNMARKNKQVVDDLPYSQQAKAYIATHVELDNALEHLLNELENAGILDNTLIAISSDHYPYGLDDITIEELSGQSVDNQFDLYKNDFIIYTPDMEATKIDTLGSSLDILPTLSNLLGLNYDSRLLVGRDIFSDAEPIVPFLDRSFITDKGRYDALTEEFTSNDQLEIDDEYIERISSIVNSKFYYSARILDTDYYGASQ